MNLIHITQYYIVPWTKIMSNLYTDKSSEVKWKQKACYDDISNNNSLILAYKTFSLILNENLYYTINHCQWAYTPYLYSPC